MPEPRVVLVDGPHGKGSGYLIGPRLVLTSAHVIEGAAAVPVYRPGDRQPVTAVVVWHGTSGGRDDAALLQVADRRRQSAGTAGVRWGEFVTALTDRPCEAQGSPELAQYCATADGPARKPYTDVWQESGTVNPGSAALSNRYVVDLRTSRPGWTEEVVPWGGFSGAALLCKGFVIGVVAAEVAHSEHGQLEVVPAYLLLRNSSFRAALVEYGADSTRLEAVEFAALAGLESLGLAGTDSSPSALLRPERETVGFHGRQDLLADLVDWCQEDEVEALLLHGPGGQGKTRLVRELARQLVTPSDGADHGPWASVWLRSDEQLTAADLALLQQTPRRMLVVLDYAENRLQQVGQLLAVTRPRELPFKVVLIARTDGDWWDHARELSSATAAVLGRAAEIPLPPLAEDPDGRPALYRAAALAFAARLPAVQGRTPWTELAAALPDRDLADPGFANLLTLHMTVLADLLDAGGPTDTPKPAGRSGLRRRSERPDDVEQRLLGHEGRYWKGLLAARGVPTEQAPDAELFRDALAAAVLLGADTPDQVDETLRRVRGLADEGDRWKFADWLAAAYPPDRAGPAHWGGLQPDRLAERFVGERVLTRRHLLPALAAGADGPAAERMLTVLSRAAGHRPLQAELSPVLTRLCTGRPDELALPALAVVPQVERPGPLLAGLESLLDAPGTGIEQLDRWRSALPDHSYHLGPWAVRLMERLVTHRRDARVGNGPDLLALVTGLRELCKRYTDTGEWSRALVVVEEAIDLLQPALAEHELATEHRTACRNGLSGCLNNQALILLRLGRLAEALAPAAQAVAINRDLAERGALEKPEHLPITLGTLAMVHGDLGDPQLALPLKEEAVERLERLVAAPGGEALQTNLVRALHNLALQYHVLGRNTEGLERSRQAIALLRPLARQRPDAHRPLLVVVLGTLSNCLGAAGRDEESVQAIEESVAIRRRLAEGRPAAYRDGLARALNSLSIALSQVGRSAEALAVVGEAVEIYNDLVEHQPRPYRDPLAMTLNSYSNELRAVGRLAEAERAAERAVAVYAELHRELRDAHAADHAMVLCTLALCLDAAGRPEESLVKLEQAVGIYRDLPGHLAGAARPDLARCLNNIAGAHRSAGRPAEGLPSCAEGVRICRELTAEDPAAHNPLLARLLTTQALCLDMTGRREEAAAVATEAVEAATPTAAQPESADTLSTLSALLSLAGRVEEAHAALRVVVAAHRRLALVDPDRHQPELLSTLSHFQSQLAVGGRLLESAEIAAEVLAIHRERWEAEPTPALRAVLAHALSNLGGVLSQLGRASEAAAHIGESVELWRAMSRSEWDASMPAPALALTAHVQVLWAAGRQAEALDTLQEVRDAFERMPDSNPLGHAGVAMTLTTRGALLEDLGEPSAPAVLDDAVRAARQIDGSGSEAYEGIVANALTVRARVRAQQEPPLPGALDDATEAVEIHRRVHLANPGRGPAGVAGAMAVLGRCLAQHGRNEQAEETTKQAVALLRDIEDPTGVLVADALFLHAEVRLLTGTDLDTARVGVREAIDRLQIIAEDRPALVEIALARFVRLRDALDALDAR
ncbi:tetratricopeptide repeat protein [Kitasatospora sp. CB01950]|uniref:tetratricopeptide repeat protein n=1 Tax=Kitasatospora sp. CB01950 TaxID=1703930 RepID=UPI00093D1B9D|nr:tetratricopeptide repeat protein [Kitasatospora sp. CB01950]